MKRNSDGRIGGSLVQVNSVGVTAGHQHPDADVKLALVDEVGVGNVLLDAHVGLQWRLPVCRRSQTGSEGSQCDATAVQVHNVSPKQTAAARGYRSMLLRGKGKKKALPAQKRSHVYCNEPAWQV